MKRKKAIQGCFGLIIASFFILSLSGCVDHDNTGSDTRYFWCWDLSVMPPLDEKVPATLRGETPHVQIYVSDDAWKRGLVTEKNIASIEKAAGWSTPASSSAGIYRINTSVFGAPPDVDRDDKIIVFYSELKSYGEHKFDGYFSSLHEGEVFMDYNSNNCDMIFLDCKNNRPDSDYLLGVLAHEFQHMIQWNVDPDEESWLNETLSQASMVLCGYYSDLDAGIRYLRERTETEALTGSDHGGYAYGAGFLFASYVIDRFGKNFIRQLSASTLTGIDSFNHVLAGVATFSGSDFYDLVLDWALAGLVNDGLIDSGEYDYGRFGNWIEPPEIKECVFGTEVTFGTEEEPGLAPSAYSYLSYDVTSGQNITIGVNGDPGDMRIKSLLRDENGDIVEIHDLDMTGGSCTCSPPSNGKMILVVVQTGDSCEMSESVLVTAP